MKSEISKPEGKRGRAPVEMQLTWLLGELGKCRERYEGMRVDALATLAKGAGKTNRYDRPAIREAKARAAAGILGQVINGLDWLLGEKRPWNKAVKTEPTNNEQTTGDSARDGR